MEIQLTGTSGEINHASPEYEDLPDDSETSIEESSILVTPDLSVGEKKDTSDIGDIDAIGDIDNISDVNNNVQEENETTEDDEGDRRKRSSGADWDKGSKTGSRRVQTADTILNIRGALRDAIGDAGAAPGPRASSRVDAFVIRPAAPAPPPPPPRAEPRAQPNTSQAPEHRELLVRAHSLARLPCDLRNATQLRWYKDSEVRPHSSSHQPYT
ncbi:hypothetical protein MSG28_015834 [Choristoneura fumiferana]|uniref:Uncharacterized protein n=1 Tax=Choristoneura fumiferana TaxID=7141 RepID=A0ACC0KBS8_CHOFU|nr:hypothetical protein MSG28_015834 [Choristoneura fumiferana]